MLMPRATLVSFNPASYLATVRLDGSGPQTLEDVPVSSAIRPEALVAGRRVLLDTGDGGEPREILVVAVDGVRDPAIARFASLLDVVNTAAESTLLSATIPANTLGSDRAVRAVLLGDYLNNTGANQTLRLRLKYGATALYDGTTGALASNAARRAVRVELVIAGQGSGSAQALGGLVAVSAPGGAAAGIGDLAGASLAVPVAGSAAENSATALTLAVTVMHSAASVNLSFRRQYGVMESG